MMADVTFGVASDYAYLDAGPVNFYYGYEFNRDADGAEVWGFEYKLSGESVLRLSFPELAAEVRGTNDQGETLDCLLAGIGVVLARGAPPMW
jgi:hypothetical protein